MKKFRTMGELALYLLRANAPNELKNAAAENMQAVEELGNGGAVRFPRVGLICYGRYQSPF